MILHESGKYTEKLLDSFLEIAWSQTGSIITSNNIIDPWVLPWVPPWVHQSKTQIRSLFYITFVEKIVSPSKL